MNVNTFRNVSRFNMVGPVEQVAERISQDVLGIDENFTGQENWFIVQVIKNHLKCYVYLLKLHDPEQVVTFQLLLEMYKDPQLVRHMHEKLKKRLVELTVLDEKEAPNTIRVIEIIDGWFDLNLLQKQERAGAMMVPVRNKDNEIVYYDAKENQVQSLRSILFDIELSLLADEHSDNLLYQSTSSFLPFGTELEWNNKNTYEPFNPEKSNNANMVILGKQGSGMNLAVKQLLVHEISQNVHSRIIDADGEYSHIVEHLLGKEIILTQNGAIRINPLEITEKRVLLKDVNIDEMNSRNDIEIMGTTEFNGKEYLSYLPVKEKIKEVCEFFDLVIKGYYTSNLTTYERDCITRTLSTLYSSDFMKNRGASPTLSDVYKILVERNPDQNMDRLLAALRPLLHDGNNPIFDGQTSFGESRDAQSITGGQLISFNLSQLDGKHSGTIAYYVILQHLKDTFMEDEFYGKINKIIYANKFELIFDNEASLHLTEQLLRRARRNRTGLRIIAKDSGRLLSDTGAKCILPYCSILLFKQYRVDKFLLEDIFAITKAEMRFLLTEPRGVESEALWMHQGKTSIVQFPELKEK